MRAGRGEAAEWGSWVEREGSSRLPVGAASEGVWLMRFTTELTRRGGGGGGRVEEEDY